jgi:hypothetical protein
MEHEPNTQYVQHISGQGRKWRCALQQNEQDHDWCVLSENGQTVHHLPCSEYRLVSPPVTVWVDVTRTVELRDRGQQLVIHATAYTLPPGYRWTDFVDAQNRYGITIQQEQER